MKGMERIKGSSKVVLGVLGALIWFACTKWLGLSDEEGYVAAGALWGPAGLHTLKDIARGFAGIKPDAPATDDE